MKRLIEGTRSPLARRFILAIILASSTITLVLTAIQLNSEYRSKLRGLDEVFEQVAKVHLKTITQALWATDTELVRLQIEGLAAVPHIEVVTVREDEKVWAQAGRQVSREIIERNYPLVYKYGDRHLELGVLTIKAGLDAVYAELLDHALSILAGNALKTFLVAVFAFALFYRLLGRHLRDVTDQLRKMDPRRQESLLRLERPDKKTADELDEIVGAINRIRAETRASYAALRANEVNYRTLFESAADGILIVDAQGRYVDVNSRACKMLGYTREEMLTLTRRDFYTDSEAAVIGSTLGSMRVGETLLREAHPKRKDGTRIAFEVSATLLPDGRVIAAHRDISERKRAEERVARSEQRLRNVIDGLGQGMFVGLMSLDGTLIEANRPVLEAAGLKLEEVIGKPLEQSYWLAYSESLQQRIREAIKRAAGGESARFEIDIRVKEGVLVPIDFSLQPFRDERGEIAYLVPSGVDISERKRAEQALRDSALQLRMAADFGKVGLFDWDMDTNKVYFSAEWKRQIGHEEHEISDEFHEWQDRLHPEDMDRALAAVQSYLANPKAGYAVEFRFRHKDGSYRWILAQAELTHDAHGKPDRMLGSHVDITDRKRAEITRDGQARVLALIAAGKPLDESLDLLMRVVESYIPEMMASVLLLNPDGVTVQHGAAPSLPIEFTRAVDGQPIGENAGSCGTAMYRREQVIVEDINTSPLWDQYRALAQTHGLRACWSTPILDMKGKVLGSFALYFRAPQGPGPEHLSLIESIASTASIAITSFRETAALRESEAKFRMFIEHAPVAIAVSDAHENITFLNLKFIEVFGYTLADIPTLKAWWQKAYPDPLNRQRIISEWQSKLEKMRREGTDSEPIEREVTCKSGNSRSILFYQAPMGNSRLSLLFDVTAHRQAETALHESEERHRSTTEMADIATWEYDFEADRTSRSTNHDRLFGLPWQDDNSIRTFAKATHPDDRERTKRIFQASMAPGGPDIFEFDFRVVWPDGSLHWLWERGGIISRDSAGRARRLRGVLLDITERKRIEKELQESEQRYRLAATTGNVWDWNFETGTASDATDDLRVLGHHESNIKLTPVLLESKIHPDDRPRWKKAISDHMRLRVPYDLDFQARVASGEYRWFNSKGQAIWNQSGHATYIAGTTFDITERKQAEAELRESRTKLEALARRLLDVQESERRTIARELHDEIGGVLTAVKLNLQSLRTKGIDEDTLADSLGLIDGAIQSVRSLSLDLRPSMLDDLGLVPALRWYCERQAQRTGIRVELSLDAIDLKNSPQLETACFRIVQESVTNALRHSGAKRIQVSLRRAEDGITLEISDDGAGFDSAVAHRRTLAGMSSGLSGMEERARLLGGTVVVTAVHGDGTSVRAVFDFPGGAAA